MSYMFNTGIEANVDGTAPWDAATDFRGMMVVVTSGYTFDADDDYLDQAGADDPVDHELTNTNYARQSLAGETTIVDDANDEVQCDATDMTFPSLGSGSTPEAVIVYLYNASDAAAQMLVYGALQSPVAPNGSNYTLVWNSEGVWEASN